ncbi:DNA-3-methyladenine glycosylase [Jiangella rhizosphaerae]|uniref:Putative 3-methyladenine DNA glycosylase n=1 Tax=Jiangella rhizosphaerae TaxID=2293569 RepID=A0A418KXI9_9ACTN|nr:DNA-3-methyladenine glycosylase [Jiangella rhizosphaerae]RIQ37771.1 DNA-3-methyladenine glycosylase [Jiangella rhizosphaerae]
METATIDRQFLARPGLDVAPGLLGSVLRHTTPEGTVAVRLTEVEAYQGADDPGSHAFRGRTPRNDVMFGPAGHLYVYFTYGMHFCANVVCDVDGTATAVLLRAGEVVEGEELAAARRPSARSSREYARGPARLTTTLGLGRADNGADLCTPGSPTQLLPGELVDPARIRTGPRVGVSGPGGDGVAFPWRFWLDGEPTVSAYRPHVPKRRK